jgi:starch-binding outer membrane protein SusE/F
MKIVKSKIFYSLLATICLLACEKEEDKVVFKGGVAPELTSSSTTNLVLAKAQEAYSSLQFQWTNPQYEFSNGTNTQDVSYTLQIDTAGSNFTNPKKIEMAFTRDLFTSFTVKQLNNTLSTMELKDFVPHDFEFRIKATLANGSVPMYSNVVKIKVTTYLDVVYPVPDNLYITGSATPASWQAGVAGEAVPPNQQFTKINSYLFQIAKLHLTFNGTDDGSNGFLLLPVYGSWSAKYGFTGDKHKNNSSGDSFKPEGSDFAPPATGDYKITVNFKTGKYSVEAVN